MKEVYTLLLLLSILALACDDLKSIECTDSVDNLTVVTCSQMGILSNRWSLNNEFVLHHRVSLIENVDGFNDWHHDPPLYELNDLPHSYSIIDIEPPFLLQKKRDNDTLVIQKDGFYLKFRMDCNESHEHPKK